MKIDLIADSCCTDPAEVGPLASTTQDRLVTVLRALGDRTRLQIFRFIAAQAELTQAILPETANDQILVRARCSLISPGTERAALTRMWDDAAFRESPGYALAGDVIRRAREICGWLARREAAADAPAVAAAAAVRVPKAAPVAASVARCRIRTAVGWPRWSVGPSACCSAMATVRRARPG